MYKDKLDSIAPVSAENTKSVTSQSQRPSVSQNSKITFESALEQLPDVVCLSHLRWDFVYQRPQHLLSRFARHKRLFFVEEPVFDDKGEARLIVSEREQHVQLVVPHLPHGLRAQQIEETLQRLLQTFFKEQQLEHYLFWYYTPMALAFTEVFNPSLVVYDCMDELSAFKFAPARLKELELALFKKADLVFTGGQSLYEAKKHQHPRIYPFPSSIDKAHFAQARESLKDPADQQAIAQPRIGFFGVIDERSDLELLSAAADARPEWQFIMLGPVVKIDPAELPRRLNIHYLGGKSYQELPAYISNWTVAMLPFALNESTRFISPTKTPEYLAAGKPVVSTPIRDVVRPYGAQELVHIAATPQDFVQSVEKALTQVNDNQWLQKVDKFLEHISWDKTWQNMVMHMGEVLQEKRSNR